MRIADRAVELEQLGARPILDEGCIEFAIDLGHLVSAERSLRRNIGTVARLHDRVRGEAALQAAIFDTRGDAERTATHIEPLARDVARPAPDLLFALIVLGKADETEHR